MLVVLCSCSKNDKDVMFALVVHCQINKEYQFISLYDFLKIIFVIPKHFALFCSSFWFGSGSTVANAQ